MSGQLRAEKLLAEAVTIDGGKAWYYRFCSETNEWTLGGRTTIRKHDLRPPSEQDRIGHETTHLPFQCWCRRCMFPNITLGNVCMGDEKEGRQAGSASGACGRDDEIGLGFS